METIGEAYSKYIEERADLDREYNNKVKEIKQNAIASCSLKSGMIIKFHNWVGRISFVEFMGILEDQCLQVMLIDSKTATRIPIDKNEFDRVEILEEPKALDMKLLNESIARLEKEEESYKGVVKELCASHDHKILEFKKDLALLRRDCIHDWKLLNSISCSGYIHKCEICKETIAKHG